MCYIVKLDYVFSKKSVEMLNSKEKGKLHCVEICPVDVSIKVLAILALQSVKFTHRIEY